VPAIESLAADQKLVLATSIDAAGGLLKSRARNYGSRVALFGDSITAQGVVCGVPFGAVTDGYSAGAAKVALS
jgi:hypothetical protein